MSFPKAAALVAVLNLLLWSAASASITPPMTDDLEWKGRIVVEFDESICPIQIDDRTGIALMNRDDLDVLAMRYNVYRISKLIPWAEKPADPGITDISRYYIIEFPQEVDLHEVAEAYGALPTVITAEPYAIRKLDYTPNDSYYGNQWAMEKVEAPGAWDYSQGSEEVIVGIVDSGTDTTHQDLRDNLWINPGEDLNQNGIIEPSEWNAVDDDGNGVVDDFWGWNVWQWNNNVQDPMSAGHGTHCAGDVTAVTDNGLGIASLGWKAKIMTARAGDGEYIYASASGISYCAENGADVISLSYGGPSYNAYEQSMINNAWDQGAVIFAAAGNDNSSWNHYPSAYNNVISVAATDQNDLKAGFSNYGPTVDICAPGVSIIGSTPGNTYSTWDGTSFSCPISAGLAALIRAAAPQFTNEQVMLLIYFTCDNIDDLNPSYAGQLGWGRINAAAAIASLFPNLSFADYEFDDSAGNGDGRPDPGETVDLLVTVENTSNDSVAHNVELTLTCDDEDITLINASNNFGDIGTSSTVNNFSDPLQFSVDAGAQPHLVQFTLTLHEDAHNLTWTLDIEQMIGRPEIIIIDDDGGSEYQEWYSQDLTDLDIAHDIWDVAARGDITDEELAIYPTAIWHTSNESDPLTETEQGIIETYLVNGGRLFLTGENIDEQLAGTDFYADVLHASSAGGSGLPQVTGIDGNPISNGQTLFLGAAGGAGNSFSPSVIEPAGDAVLIYEYSNVLTGAGISWEGADGKLVYLPFCFEAVSGAGGTTLRTEVIFNILDWFGEPPSVRTKPNSPAPEAFSLLQNYPNPFNSSTEIAFTLPEKEQIKITVVDLAGRTIATLYDGVLNAGYHVVTFKDESLSSGIYLYRLDADGFTATRKMIYMK